MARYPGRDRNHPKRTAALSTPLIIAAAALGFWGFISVLMFGESAPASGDSRPQTATSSESYTPPDWSHIETYQQGQRECPDQNNECRRVAAVNEWGAMCSTWLRMESPHAVSPEARDNPDALFNGRLFIRDHGVIELTGSKAETDDVGWHYRYGCRIDTSEERITGLALPTRADQELEYMTFH